MVPVQHHGTGRALDGHVGFLRERAELGHAKHVHALSLEDVDVMAIGFHKIRFIDALLLVVRPGVIRAFDARCCGVGPPGRLGGTVVHGHVTFECYVASPAVVVLFLHRLEQLNASFLKQRRFQRGFQIFAVIVRQELGADDAARWNGGPIVGQHHVGDAVDRLHRAQAPGAEEQRDHQNRQRWLLVHEHWRSRLRYECLGGLFIVHTGT